jgi:hypothetical protein
MSYAQTVREHRRAAILRHLEQSGDYTSNAAILADVLNGIGIATTRDQAIGELAWLQEQGLASLTDHGDFTDRHRDPARRRDGARRRDPSRRAPAAAGGVTCRHRARSINWTKARAPG